MASPIAAAAITPEKPTMNPPIIRKVDSVMSNNDNKDNVIAAAAKTSGDGVRILELHEWKEAALSLAEAFVDDDVSKYFIDTPDRPHWTKEQKWELHVNIMEYITYAHLLRGLVVSAGPNYDCVALWYVSSSVLRVIVGSEAIVGADVIDRMPPSNNMDDILTILRSGLWRLKYQLSHEGRKRFFDEFLPLLHDTKAQVLGDRDDHSWYLVYIGTRPSGRGKGCARKVIEFVTERADREGSACYLESSNEVNRKIYGRMGFELRKNIWLQRVKENVMLDIMVREPQTELLAN